MSRNLKLIKECLIINIIFCSNIMSFYKIISYIYMLRNNAEINN